MARMNNGRRTRKNVMKAQAGCLWKKRLELSVYSTGKRTIDKFTQGLYPSVDPKSLMTMNHVMKSENVSEFKNTEKKLRLEQLLTKLETLVCQ